MAQNLGNVVTIGSYSAKNGIIRGSVDGAPVAQFTSYDLVANQQMTLLNSVLLDSSRSTSYPSYVTFEAPKIIVDTVVSGSYYGVSISNNGKNSLTFNNSSVNFDDAEYDTDQNYIGPIAFTGSSSINITTTSNGKTLIKASTLTGTVSLDVEDGVQEGDTFLIEATDNQLVITNREWTVTPSTSGNITTYTLAKATLQKPKFRLLYTVG